MIFRGSNVSSFLPISVQMQLYHCRKQTGCHWWTALVELVTKHRKYGLSGNFRGSQLPDFPSKQGVS
jgi:hypothetical protein